MTSRHNPQRENVLDLRAAGHSLMEISQGLHLTYNTVVALLRRARDTDPRARRIPQRQGLRRHLAKTAEFLWDDHRDGILIRMTLRGETERVCARALGCPLDRVSKRLVVLRQQGKLAPGKSVGPNREAGQSKDASATPIADMPKRTKVPKWPAGLFASENLIIRSTGRSYAGEDLIRMWGA